MPIRYPPRREPRVLAVDLSATGLAFASVDPWTVRSAGRLECEARARALALLRLMRREKPTAAVTPSARLGPCLRRAARRAAIPVVLGPVPELPLPVATDLYPELPVLAPGSDLRALATLAISAVLHARIPSRPYAPRRHNPPERRAT